MTSENFRTNPMFLRNQFKGDGIFDIPLLKTDEIDLEEIELIPKLISLYVKGE